MSKRTLLLLSSITGLFFLFSANAEMADTPITKQTLRDTNEFVVKENWIACYKDKNGSPSDDIVKVFYSGERIYPQYRQDRAPYSEYENQRYLWVKYNDTAAQGCFVKATTASISAVKSAATENPASIASGSANNIENIAPVTTESQKNAPSDNVSAAPHPPAESNTEGSLKINCVAPGTTVTRRLETSYENYPSKLPCRVVYFREDGTTQIIAEAKATEGYCKEKRDEFLEKLKGWGWQCK